MECCPLSWHLQELYTSSGLGTYICCGKFTVLTTKCNAGLQGYNSIDYKNNNTLIVTCDISLNWLQIMVHLINVNVFNSSWNLWHVTLSKTALRQASLFEFSHYSQI